MADGEPGTPEQVADFLREVGMRHVGENEWIAEGLSPRTLHPSEYEVAEALT